MIELPLTKDLAINIIDYMETKGYSLGTQKLYTQHINMLFKRHKVLNRNTINSILKKYKLPFQRAVLSLINSYCTDNEIDFNIKIPKLIGRNHRKVPETLSIDEIKIMIEAVKKKLPEENYDLLLRCIFGFGSGLRISEAIQLNFSHFNWATWLQNRESQGIYVIKTTKRNKSFPVNVPNKIMVDVYALARKKNKLNEYGLPEGLMFDFGMENIEKWEYVLRKSNPMLWKAKYIRTRYDYFRYHILEKICNPAIGKKIKIHSLRHSRATFLLEQGLPIEEISKLLGHSDIQTTLIYAHTNIKNTIKKMENIPSL